MDYLKFFVMFWICQLVAWVMVTFTEPPVYMQPIGHFDYFNFFFLWSTIVFLIERTRRTP